MAINKCNIIRDVLPLYIDDIVSEDTKKWVKRHLVNCPECAKLLEDMQKTTVVPPETDVGALKRFKKRIKWDKIIAALSAAMVVLAIVICACYWLFTIEIIEYDGSNIEIKEIDGGYGLVLSYNGQGDVDYGFSTQVDTGISKLIVTQVRWKKYIEPLFCNVHAEYFLINTYDTLRIEMQNGGEILWQADPKQREMYYEKRAAEAEE